MAHKQLVHVCPIDSSHHLSPFRFGATGTSNCKLSFVSAMLQRFIPDRISQEAETTTKDPGSIPEFEGHRTSGQERLAPHPTVSPKSGAAEGHKLQLLTSYQLPPCAIPRSLQPSSVCCPSSGQQPADSSSFSPHLSILHTPSETQNNCMCPLPCSAQDLGADRGWAVSKECGGVLDGRGAGRLLPSSAAAQQPSSSSSEVLGNRM